jgi:hypothetical protein
MKRKFGEPRPERRTLSVPYAPEYSLEKYLDCYARGQLTEDQLIELRGLNE